MKIIKKMSVGSWLYVATFLLSLIAFIIYCANCAGAGYFQGTGNSTIYLELALSFIFAAAIVVLPFIPAKGVTKDVINVIIIVLKIATAMLLVAAAMSFIAGRAEGLAYIYGSNEDVKAEVQTPENLGSAQGAITGIIFSFLSWVVSLVAAFFQVGKEEQAEEVKANA